MKELNIEFNIELPLFAENTCSIIEFGAKGDGNFSNTSAFRSAINYLVEAGGGTLEVPKGIWLTGPVELKSNINLHLQSGAVLLFSKNKEEYPIIFTDYEGQPCVRATSPIYAKNASNIAITGSGVIDGNGQLWRPIKEFKMTERQWNSLLSKSSYVLESDEGGIWVPTESIFNGYKKGFVNFEEPDAIIKASEFYDLYRPVLMSLQYCDKVLIEGVTIQNSPAWNVHPFYCENLTIRNTTIFNPYHAQNGDGIDIESCKYVHIHHCSFQTGDDAICIKSGKNAIARQKEGPTKYVYIHDCYVGWGHGGFVIGSEMSRNVEDVFVENCTFIGTDVGVRVKSAIGRGGVVKNIFIKNINMEQIKEEAIVISMDYVHNIMAWHEQIDQFTDPEDIPEFSDIALEGIICRGADMAVKVVGLEVEQDTIQNITVRDSTFIADKEYDVRFAKNVIFENVKIVNPNVSN